MNRHTEICQLSLFWHMTLLRLPSHARILSCDSSMLNLLNSSTRPCVATTKNVQQTSTPCPSFLIGLFVGQLITVCTYWCPIDYLEADIASNISIDASKVTIASLVRLDHEIQYLLNVAQSVGAAGGWKCHTNVFNAHGKMESKRSVYQFPPWGDDQSEPVHTFCWQACMGALKLCQRPNPTISSGDVTHEDCERPCLRKDPGSQRLEWKCSLLTLMCHDQNLVMDVGTYPSLKNNQIWVWEDWGPMVDIHHCGSP